jgi:hypothetical protein
MHVLDQQFLGEVRAFHGPRELIDSHLASADAAARSIGLRLKVRTDFERLVALNLQHADSWSSLAPMFDPRSCDLSAERAFWLEGVDEAGATAVVHAARLYDHGMRSVADDLESLRAFYDDPEPRRVAGDRVILSAPIARTLGGRATFVGAMWVRPDYRRLGLSRIVPGVTRSYALARWNTPLFWALLRPELDSVGLTQAYGSWQIGGSLLVHLQAWRCNFQLLFLWMDEHMLVADLSRASDQATTESLRRMEMAMTNTSPPPPRHGNRTRS